MFRKLTSALVATSLAFAPVVVLSSAESAQAAPVTLSGHAIDHNAKKVKKSTKKVSKKKKAKKVTHSAKYYENKKYSYNEILTCYDVAFLANDYIYDGKIDKKEKKFLKEAIKGCANTLGGL